MLQNLLGARPCGALVRGLILAACAGTASAQTPDIAITGYLANPAGTDSPFEYTQFTATRDIDFAANNYSVVWANNGTANANGWVAGGSLTYGFNLTAGSVKRGETFYVGGSGQAINGTGSTSLAGEKWIRSIATGTTAGDGLGNAGSTGVLGNAGTSADGIAVFSGLTSGLTSGTAPIDNVFFGPTLAAAVVSGGAAGFELAVNDRYNGGKLQTTSFSFNDPAASGGYQQLFGRYSTLDAAGWSTRTNNTIALTAASPVSAIARNFEVLHERTWNLATGGAWKNDVNVADDVALKNWAGNNTDNYLDGDRVTFNNSAGGTIAIDAAGVNPNRTTVSAAAGTYVFTGGAIASGNLVKSGAGVLDIQNSNTYADGTTINGGTLLANNTTGSATGSGAVTVNSGGTLGGNGAVAGLVTVNAGGFVSPGNSPDTLNLDGGLDMSAGGTYLWELAAPTVAGAGTNYDQLFVTSGNTTLGGTSQLSLAFLNAGTDPTGGNAFWDTAQQWLILDGAGSTLAGNFASIANGTFANGFFSVSSASNQVFLNWNIAAVPEPGSLALLAAAAAGAWAFRRRRD